MKRRALSAPCVMLLTVLSLTIPATTAGAEVNGTTSRSLSTIDSPDLKPETKAAWAHGKKAAKDCATRKNRTCTEVVELPLTDPIVLAQIETATEASQLPAGSAAAPSDDEMSRRATTGEIYSEEAAKYFQCGNGNGTPKILTRTSSCKLSAFGLITAEPRVLPGMTLTTVAVERTTKTNSTNKTIQEGAVMALVDQVGVGAAPPGFTVSGALSCRHETNFERRTPACDTYPGGTGLLTTKGTTARFISVVSNVHIPSSIVSFNTIWSFTFRPTMALMFADTAITNPSGVIRCDIRVGEERRSEGCVFPGFVPTHTISPSGKNDEYTRHVSAAIQSGLPSRLHRATAVQEKENLKWACTKDVPRPDGTQCDEYPFKSTAEGAGSQHKIAGPRTFSWCNIPLSRATPGTTGSKGWSECLVKSNANASGDGSLGVFFTTNRILAKDAFDVAVRSFRSVAIVGGGDQTGPNLDSINALQTQLQSLGYVVTTSPHLPEGNLDSFQAIFVMDTSPMDVGSQTRLVEFVKGGRGLYLTGERPCCESVNVQATHIVNSLIKKGTITAGGIGDVATTSPVTINQQVTGDLSATPNTLSTITMAYSGGITGVTGANVLAQVGDVPVAAAWDSGDVEGGGRIVLIMDINWLEPAYRDATTSSQNIENITTFLTRG